MEKKKNVPVLRFPEFSGEWEQKKLGDISKISSGGTPSRSNSDYWNGNIPWVSTTLVDYTTIYKSDEYITEEGVKNSSAKVYPIGTLLMAIYGQGKTRGKVALLGIEATTNQACLAIIPDKKVLSEVFLFQNLACRYDEIRNLSNQGGQENLRGELIKSVIINSPALLEQQKIASFNTLVDDKLQALKKKKNLLEQYKKGMMQKIFSHEICFKDDNRIEYPKWKTMKLGNSVEIKKGQQLNVTELFDEGFYPALNGGINPSGYTDKWNTDANTISISEGGNSCGYVNFNKKKFWSGGHCYTILNISPLINSLFLFQLLKFNEILIMRLRVGSGLPNIQKKDLNELILNLPVIEEQTKIANFLSAIDDKINLCNAQIEKTEQWKKGLLQKMFV